MSGQLEEMFHCIEFQKVPAQWEKAGYPCLKPLASWIEDFFGRIAHMDGWLMGGPPSSFWLSGYFFPQGFMTAVKQGHSRKYAIAIDTLGVGCEMQQIMDSATITQPPNDGVYIIVEAKG